jgi:cholesterol oxidase
MQLAGRHLRLGSPTGLYDVRFGEDMHVLIGCGLGGGSLINAGVALRPDPRVFRDPVWPAEIGADGLIDEGYARAARWVRPARDAAAPSAPSTKRSTARAWRSARRRSRPRWS